MNIDEGDDIMYENGKFPQCWVKDEPELRKDTSPWCPQLAEKKYCFNYATQQRCPLSCDLNFQSKRGFKKRLAEKVKLLFSLTYCQKKEN